jgi:hypothetical protein
VQREALVSRTEFFPYRFAAQALHLEYDLDADLGLGDGGNILAVDLPEAATVALTLKVSVENGTYERVLPPDEHQDPPIAVVVAVRSIPSRTRRLVHLERSDAGWAGTIDLAKAELFREATLTPAMVRVAGGDDPRYAEHAGAWLASGDEVRIEVDDAPVPPGGYLDVKFDNFREGPSPKRNQHPDLLYVLDTDRETPILWLNEDVDEFKGVMLSKGRRGYNLRVRDAMFDTLGSQVWTSLASLAFTNLALTLQQQRETDDESDPFESLSEWHQRVLNFWAPRLFEGSRPEAMEEVRRAAADTRLLPDLFDRLSVAVQQWLESDRVFRGLIRMRDREGV